MVNTTNDNKTPPRQSSRKIPALERKSRNSSGASNGSDLDRLRILTEKAGNAIDKVTLEQTTN